MLRHYIIISVLSCMAGLNCSRSDGGNNNGNNNNGNNGASIPDAEFWLTTANAGITLEKQSPLLSFGTAANGNPFIDVDSTTTMQAIDGFGYTLTGGSAS